MFDNTALILESKMNPKELEMELHVGTLDQHRDVRVRGPLKIYYLRENPARLRVILLFIYCHTGIKNALNNWGTWIKNP